MATRKMRRTWLQRLTLLFVCLAAIGCLGAAGALGVGQWVLSQRQLLELAEPTTEFAPDADAVVVEPGAVPMTTVAEGIDPTVTTTTIPLAEPEAANFLITGADGGDCVNSNDPTVGNRDSTRSDTIMVWRTNPATDQLAVLSFPRDLYVDIGGSKNRINAAYRRDEPDRLIDTIYRNFGVPIDHYIQIDFCAFRELVNAVGGVEVPFEYAARDVHSGLNIPVPGCVTLDGDMALSYVRSRKYQYEDPAGSGNWRTDGTSDFGRIARQQDFIRRIISKVISNELYNPEVIGALYETNRNYVVTDDELTLRRIQEFANTLRRLDPASITTYRIESYSETINGAKVEIPRIRGENMQAILAVFQGAATLAEAPEQSIIETTTTTPTTTDTSRGATDQDASSTITSTSVPTVEAEENNLGIAPDRFDTC